MKKNSTDSADIEQIKRSLYDNNNNNNNNKSFINVSMYLVCTTNWGHKNKKKYIYK